MRHAPHVASVILSFMSDAIVFIYGMFMTPHCWDGWSERFAKAGHTVQAPAWPGRHGSVEELRSAHHADAAIGRW